MAAPKGKVCHYTDVPAVAVGEQGPGASLRWLIDDARDGAPVYALRMVELAAGGHSPHHTHPYEHENFVVEGQGRVLIGETWHDVAPGSVVFVPGGVRHTYVNAGEVPFRFLCGIPTTRLLHAE